MAAYSPNVGLPKRTSRRITNSLSAQGFGSKLWPWTHCPLAVAAARQVGKTGQARA